MHVWEDSTQQHKINSPYLVELQVNLPVSIVVSIIYVHAVLEEQTSKTVIYIFGTCSSVW